MNAGPKYFNKKNIEQINQDPHSFPLELSEELILEDTEGLEATHKDILKYLSK
ncbi:MAG: hypothetical protein V1914_04600 [archaeon]